MQFPDRFKLNYDEMFYLLKNAQDRSVNDAKMIASQLAQKLVAQQAEDEKNPGYEIYFKDIDSLDHYLDFLRTNNRHAPDGLQTVIITDAGINMQKIPAEQQSLYTKIGRFSVYVSDVIASLNDLKPIADQPGNQAMKPALKRLIEEFNATAKQNVDATPGSGQGAPAGQQGTGSPAGIMKFYGKDTNHLDIYTDDSGKYWAVSKDKNGKPAWAPYNGGVAAASGTPAAAGQQAEQLPAETVNKISEVLSQNTPFDSSRNELSPLRMYRFVYAFWATMSTSVKQKEGLFDADTTFIEQLAEYNRDITSTWEEWKSFVEKVQSQSGASRSNARAALNVVTYPLGNDPNGKLANQFGTTENGNQAAVYLKEMIDIVEKTMNLIVNKPSLGAKFGAFFKAQQVQAQSYYNALNSY